MPTLLSGPAAPPPATASSPRFAPGCGERVRAVTPPTAKDAGGWPQLTIAGWEDARDTSDGSQRLIVLEPRSVASFYREVMATLDDIGMNVDVLARPVEVARAIPFLDDSLGEFLLPYAAVRTADDPDASLLAFLQSTYEAAADLAGWNRAALETHP